MLVTINGTLRAIDARITFPLSGVWVGSFTLDTETLPIGPCSIETPGATLMGMVRTDRSGVFRGTVKLIALGGAGGYGTELKAKGYSGATVQTILADILGEADETLSKTVDATLLARVLPRWNRSASTAGAALAVLLDALGLTWRVLDDGTTWIGMNAWAPITLDHQVIEDDEAHSRVVIGADAATLRPGYTLDNRKITLVRYEFSTSARATVEYELSPLETDRLGASIVRVVRHEVRELDYHALYPARVLAQANDLTNVDVLPDTDRIPPQLGVPLRTGPGVELKVNVGAGGARVLLGFENADPQRMYAVPFETGGLVEWHFAGTSPVGRVGDAVDGGTFFFTNAGTLSTYFPGGTPLAVIAAWQGGHPTDVAVPVAAVIQVGSSKLKA